MGLEACLLQRQRLALRRHRRARRLDPGKLGVQPALRDARPLGGQLAHSWCLRVAREGRAGAELRRRVLIMLQALKPPEPRLALLEQLLAHERQPLVGLRTFGLALALVTLGLLEPRSRGRVRLLGAAQRLDEFAHLGQQPPAGAGKIGEQRPDGVEVAALGHQRLDGSRVRCDSRTLGSFRRSLQPLLDNALLAVQSSCRVIGRA